MLTFVVFYFRHNKEKVWATLGSTFVSSFNCCHEITKLLSNSSISLRIITSTVLLELIYKSRAGCVCVD